MLTAENGRIYVMFRGPIPYVTTGLHWAEIFRILLYGPFLGIELGPRRRAPIYAGAAIEVSRRLRIVPECVIDLGGRALTLPQRTYSYSPASGAAVRAIGRSEHGGPTFQKNALCPHEAKFNGVAPLVMVGGSHYSGSGGYYWAGRRLSPDRSGAGLLQVYQGPFA